VPACCDQARLRAVDRTTAFDDLFRQPDQARLLRERVADRAANAEARVRVEVGTACGVVLLDRVEQAEGALLYEVVERKPEVPIAPRDGPDELELRADEPIARDAVASPRSA
jgi:hypothetical protein